MLASGTEIALLRGVKPCSASSGTLQVSSPNSQGSKAARSLLPLEAFRGEALACVVGGALSCAAARRRFIRKHRLSGSGHVVLRRAVKEMSASAVEMSRPLPEQPLPAPLLANDGLVEGAPPEDVFTWDTVTKRMPKILDSVLSSLPKDLQADEDGIVAPIRALQAEMSEGKPLRLLEDTGAAVNASEWNSHIWELVESSQGWHDAPWWIVENYMYKRLLEILARAGAPSLDPFAPQKAEAMESAVAALEASIHPILSKIDEASSSGSEGDRKEALRLAILRSLWGNQADLSLSAGKVESLADAGELITDHVSLAIDTLAGAAGKTILLVLDNHGLEVICDMLLADTILRLEAAETVVLHVKDSPVFVSDVTEADVEGIMQWLCERSPAMGQRLRDFQKAGRLQVRNSTYYTSALSYWELPSDLAKEYSDAAAVVIKGDANYRRLLGDRHWPYDTDFPAYVQSFWPCRALVSLRTMKSGVALGIDQTKQAEAKAARPNDWLTAGVYGQVLASLRS
mmetsp:Transcript_4491/g.9746  ORF Transcript_4491/g.9746 Transcript_4491/m.9746 type:complete len:515 (-) Transcript_4491:91-1635(-)